jgi:hypothetical protein
MSNYLKGKFCLFIEFDIDAVQSEIKWHKREKNDIIKKKLTNISDVSILYLPLSYKGEALRVTEFFNIGAYY